MKEMEDDFDELERIWRAMMLSPADRNGLAVCAALLRGETVPVDKLDPEWLDRFGRR